MISRNNNYKNAVGLRAEDCIGKIVVLGPEMARPNDEQRPLLFYVDGVDMDRVLGVCGERHWALCLSGRFLEDWDCTDRPRGSSVPVDRVARLANFEEARDFVYDYFDDWACLTPEILNSISSLAGTAVEEGSELDDYGPDGPGPWDPTDAAGGKAPEGSQEPDHPKEPEEPEEPVTTGNSRLEDLFE